MKTPKEDPADKANRMRERRISELEQDQATQKQAAGLTSDIRAVYGLRAMSLFGRPGAKPATPRPSPPAPQSPSRRDRGPSLFGGGNNR